MNDSTWRTFCQLIIEKTGGKLLLNNDVYPQSKFKCTICGMVWNGFANLDGKKHLALQNRCGGTWVKT